MFRVSSRPGTRLRPDIYLPSLCRSVYSGPSRKYSTVGQDSEVVGLRVTTRGKMRRAACFLLEVASIGEHARTDVGLLEIQPLGLPFGQQEDREGTK